MRQPWKLPFTYEFKCEFCQGLFYSNIGGDRDGACNHAACQNAFIKEKEARFKIPLRIASYDTLYNIKPSIHLHDGTSTLCKVESTGTREITIGDLIPDVENYHQPLCQRCMKNWNFYYKS